MKRPDQKVFNIRIQLGAWVGTVPILHNSAREAHRLALDHLNTIAYVDPKATGKPCYLHTLSGTKEAIAGPRGLGLWRVHTIDGDYSIEVNEPTAKRKFEAEDKPTFYAC